MTYSAGNPETIGQSSEGAITVDNGCEPWYWTVSGTGFSFKYYQTFTATNTLEADDTACGAASITVTDGCGTGVNGVVRSTEGEWTAIGGGSASCPTGCNVCGGASHTREIITENKRWYLYTLAPYHDQCTDKLDLVWVSGGDPTPSCGDPLACWDGPTCTCGPPEEYGFFGLFQYQEWNCA